MNEWKKPCCTILSFFDLYKTLALAGAILATCITSKSVCKVTTESTCKKKLIAQVCPDFGLIRQYGLSFHTTPDCQLNTPHFSTVHISEIPKYEPSKRRFLKGCLNFIQSAWKAKFFCSFDVYYHTITPPIFRDKQPCIRGILGQRATFISQFTFQNFRNMNSSSGVLLEAVSV